MKKLILLVGFMTGSYLSFGQVDSVGSQRLEEVVIQSSRLPTIERLPDVQGTYLFSGKKNEVIQISSMDANLVEKTGRQIFAKVPGVFVYDMDGSGNQVNISTRGLDPHRGWEFNIRANGVITNSDMYGYPASHYSMPMEAVDRIQIVRGSGSLQYGAQFGGMLNFVTKQPDTTKAFGFENINSVGSFGLMGTYLAVGGKAGKVQYSTFYSRRVSDGYRANGKSDYNSQGAMISIALTNRLKLKAELMHSAYLYQIPGPLTDAMFYADPRQSTRSRNYFNPDIFVPSINLEWMAGRNTKLSWTTSAVLGARNSVQFDKPATMADVQNPITQQYVPRQVDIDHFNSFTTELRVLHHYTLWKGRHTMAGGIQLFNNDLHRQQLGIGTTGTDFDLTVTSSGFGRDLHFKTRNIAVYMENSFRLTPRLTVSPGFRAELGQSDMTGQIIYYDPGHLPTSISHQFPLFGLNTEFKINQQQNLYAGIVQSYRPVLFKDIIPTSTYEVIDKNLKDAMGYTIDAGYRGKSASFSWDISMFKMVYNNRMGALSFTDSNGNYTLYRTNIGNSVTRGVELFAEKRFQVSKVSVTVFNSTALFHARYQEAEARMGNENIAVNGNKVEGVPDIITRSGLTAKLRMVSVTFLYSFTGSSYADALNTVTPSTTGAVGLVPEYQIMDVNASAMLGKHVTLKLMLNNITDQQYFTKRPTMYPGPGVWTSDGRSFGGSIGFKF